jgi:hypothetical protein
MNYINKFETWVASWLPGAKTKIIAGLGALGMFAAYTQEYVTGLPLVQFMKTETVALVNAGLFTVAYWTRRLTDKE